MAKLSRMVTGHFMPLTERCIGLFECNLTDLERNFKGDWDCFKSPTVHYSHDKIPLINQTTWPSRLVHVGKISISANFAGYNCQKFLTGPLQPSPAEPGPVLPYRPRYCCVHRLWNAESHPVLQSFTKEGTHYISAILAFFFARHLRLVISLIKAR